MSVQGLTWDVEPEKLSGSVAATLRMRRQDWEKAGASFIQVEEDDGDTPYIAAGEVVVGASSANFGVLSYPDDETSTYLVTDGPYKDRPVLTSDIIGRLIGLGAVPSREVVLEIVGKTARVPPATPTPESSRPTGQVTRVSVKDQTQAKKRRRRVPKRARVTLRYAKGVWRANRRAESAEISVDELLARLPPTVVTRFTGTVIRRSRTGDFVAVDLDGEPYVLKLPASPVTRRHGFGGIVKLASPKSPAIVELRIEPASATQRGTRRSDARDPHAKD